MTRSDRSWIVLTALCLVAPGCTDRPAEASTEGDSEDGDSGTTAATTTPTIPNPTQPSMDTGVMTEADTTAATDPTTGPSDTTSGPAGDGCCEVHESPGCPEPDVVDCVCAQEAFCCAFEWDQTCVDLATGECMATCEEPGTSDGPATTTGVGDDCEDVVQFEMQPSEAIQTGSWDLGMSMVGEGEISIYDQMGGGGGSILFEPDIPCNDTWYIWVRYWEQGDADSYFATLDGMPMPEAIFEGDCTGGGNGYDWAALNWRDQRDGPCTYVEDPWAPTWDAGTHSIEFTFRESLAMGRILLTNDPAYVP